MTSKVQQRRWTLILLLVCLGVSLFCVVYPIYVIRPFRTQGERELGIALLIIRFRPLVMIISAVMALVAASGYWRAQARKGRRILAVAASIFTCMLGFLARVNIYELMFHRIDHPSFAEAAGAKLDPEEKVIAIKIGGRARAYPIRSISYHHVVNDVVESKAIVATY